MDEDLHIAFKTALISTPYTPLEQQQVDPVTLIREFTATGSLRPALPMPTTAVMPVEDEVPTEMAMVVERIKQVPPPSGGWRVHAVWQPPLKDSITLHEVLQRCDQQQLDGTRWYASPVFGVLTIPIGLLDRPAAQVQEPVLLDFSGSSGHLAIVGAPQSGKSTLLHTIMASFMITHTPALVQVAVS